MVRGRKLVAIRQRVRFALERVIFVLSAVAFAKVCQYAAVDAFEERLGFDLASASGAVPALLVFAFIEYRFLRPRRYAASTSRQHR